MQKPGVNNGTPGYSDVFLDNDNRTLKIVLSWCKVLTNKNITYIARGPCLQLCWTLEPSLSGDPELDKVGLVVEPHPRPRHCRIQ